MKTWLALRKYWLMLLGCILCLYHIYFLWLIQQPILFADLLYADVLVLCFLFVFLGLDIIHILRQQRDIKQLTATNDFILCEEITEPGSFQELFQHNEEYYHQALANHEKRLEELQDYISRWSHEIKLPLAALRMMNERNEDFALRQDMQKQLERMESQLRSMLCGTKTWMAIYDRRMQWVSLKKVIQAAIKNASYFLIQEGFAIQLDDSVDRQVLSDEQWLGYMLDQIIANAIKYHKEAPCLRFSCDEEETLCLHIIDYGEGIDGDDIPMVFERGYCGKEVRNGQYRSTGMGLYFVKKIADMLGHPVNITSQKGKYTDVQIIFCNDAEYFHLTKS